MSHAIDFSNARANMAYVGAVPWHGHGQVLTQGAPIEVWIREAGMDYTVELATVQYFTPSETTLYQTRQYDGRKVAYRSDTGAALAVVSDRFKMVQPAEILEFFRDLTGRMGFELETAGVLKGGAVYWALARVGEPKYINGDYTRPYVLLTTACDGSLATQGRFTTIRVVCNNTLTWSVRDGSDCVKVRHNTTFNASAMKRDLGIVDFDAAFEDMSETMRKLGDISVNAEQATQYFSDLLRPPKERRQELQAQEFSHLVNAPAAFSTSHKIETAETKRAIRGLDQLQDCYYKAPGARPGTAYGLVQGVTRFIDHERGSDKGRLQSAWFGQGDRLKSQAVEKALDLVD